MLRAGLYVDICTEFLINDIAFHSKLPLQTHFRTYGYLLQATTFKKERVPHYQLYGHNNIWLTYRNKDKTKKKLYVLLGISFLIHSEPSILFARPRRHDKNPTDNMNWKITGLSFNHCKIKHKQIT